MIGGRRLRYVDMTEGAVLKNFMLFVIPLILTNLLQIFYNMVDSVIVGKFAGPDELASVGVCGSVYGLLVSLLGGLAGGASVLVAQRFGAKDYDGIHNAVHTSYATAIVGGLLLTVVGFLSMKPVFALTKVPPEILPGACRYMGCIYAGLVPTMIYNFGAGILRSVGDSGKPLIFLIISAFVNIVLNLIFVIGFGMGALGVGIATLVSHIISAILVTFVLCRTYEMHKLIIKDIRFYKDSIGKILTIGVPTGIQSSMFAISNTTIITYVNTFGVLAIAANSIEGNISNIAYCLTGAFSTAVITFAGQNYGKKQFDRIYKGGMKCALSGASIVAVFCFTAMAFSGYFPYIFTDSAEVAAYAQLRSLILLPLIPLDCIGQCLSAVIRGCGKSVFSMIASIVCICITRILWIVIGLKIFYDLRIIYSAYPASYVVFTGVVLGYFMLFKKRWLK